MSNITSYRSLLYCQWIKWSTRNVLTCSIALSVEGISALLLEFVDLLPTPWYSTGSAGKSSSKVDCCMEVTDTVKFLVAVANCEMMRL
jgi:hypothetical protein